MKYASVQLGYEYAITTHDPLQYENHLVEAKSPLPTEMRLFRGLLYLARCFGFRRRSRGRVAGSHRQGRKRRAGFRCRGLCCLRRCGFAAPKKHAVIDQRDKQFVPYVTAVQVGTPVHVSRTAITFDITFTHFRPRKNSSCRFTAAFPHEPVVFDKVGFVTLGCNIHDWMIAYVAVLPTPYFQVTDKMDAPC